MQMGEDNKLKVKFFEQFGIWNIYFKKLTIRSW